MSWLYAGWTQHPYPRNRVESQDLSRSGYNLFQAAQTKALAVGELCNRIPNL